MGKICRTYGSFEKCIKKCSSENLKRRAHSEYLSVDILEWILGK